MAQSMRFKALYRVISQFKDGRPWRAKFKLLTAVSGIALMVVATGPAPYVFAKSYRDQSPVPQQSFFVEGLTAQPEEEPEEDEAEEEAEREAEEEAEDEAEAEAEDEAEDEAESEAEDEAENEAEQEAEREAENEAEEEAEREAEQEAEDQAEDEAENEAEAEAEEEAEDEAEAEAEDEAEQEAEQEAENEAEEEAEAEAERAAENEAEEEAEREAEQEAEDEAEDEAEGEAEEEAEAEAENEAELEAEAEAEDEAERQAEFEAEEEAEREVEDIAEREAEDDYEDEFDDDVEDDLDDDIEDEAEEEFEDDVEREEEDDLEDEADEEIERQSEQESEDDADDLDEDDFDEDDVNDDDFDDEDFDDEDDFEEDGEENDVGDDEDFERDIDDLDRLERVRRDVREIERMDRIELMADRAFEEVFDEVGEAYIQDEVLVLIDVERELELEVERYIDEDRIRLDGLDMVLVRARIGEDYSLDESVQSLGNLVTDGAVDVNHVFETEAFQQATTESLVTPAAFGALIGMAPQFTADEAIIGLVDTKVQASHPAFAGRRIVSEDFARFTDKRPIDHGTAVASILVGQGNDGYRGLMPDAQLYAASVFVEPAPGRQVATTESLILAIDWMVRNRVPIVNMSLSGPANELLELAITRAASRGSHVVAAVGNAGPNAKPLYPAAYENVIAVTAIDRESRVFLRANRGGHVDFSAPGVNVLTAQPNGGYTTKTGTSMAAPFVTAVLSHGLNQDQTRGMAGLLSALRAEAKDLGDPGFDPTYGYGLIQLSVPVTSPETE